MAPSFANRDPDSNSRMRLRGEPSNPAPLGAAGFARQETAFIIGNKAFFVAVKRAIDIAGGFAIVGAFKMEDLATSLRRSKVLGQTPRVAVIHEPPGERSRADDAAHGVLEHHPGCGIVLISGDALEVESERKLHVHDFNAIVMPETVVKNPQALANSMHAAISEAGTASGSASQTA